MRGGRFRESLSGGGGRDVLEGGQGNDRLVDGDRAALGIDGDVLDGGEGRDNVAYFDRTARVVVRLAREGGQGQRGENDTIRDVESIHAGSGPDLLVGDHGGNVLYGGAGNDSVHGGGGNDQLDGEEGVDRVSGGDGRDRIRAEDLRSAGPTRLRERVHCGRGSDVVTATGPSTLLGGDCERVIGVFAALLPTSVRPAVDHAATRAVHCLPCQRIGSRRSSRCTASIVLRDLRGRLVGRGRGAVTTRPARFIRIRFATFRVPMRLTPYARRMLRRRGRLTVRGRMVSTMRVPGLGRSRRIANYAFVLTRES